MSDEWLGGPTMRPGDIRIKIRCNDESHVGKICNVDSMALLLLGSNGSREQFIGGSNAVHLAGQVPIDRRELFGSSQRGPTLPPSARVQTRERYEWQCDLCGPRSRLVVTAETARWLFDLARQVGVAEVWLKDLAATLQKPDKRER